MARVREINFNEYMLFQLIESYWTDVYKSRNNRNWKYFQWKFEFRSKLTDAMKKEWTNSLLDFTLFIQKLIDLSYDFDPTTNINNVLSFEKLFRITDQSKKTKGKREKRRISYTKVKPLLF